MENFSRLETPPDVPSKARAPVFRFPLRVKILIALLCVVTAVVSVITITMANLFHTDKQTYIHDLTSIIALHTAEEAKSLLISYLERTHVVTRLIVQPALPPDVKTALLKDLFQDFDEFVAITIHEPGRKPVTLYDEGQLDAARLTKKDFLAFRSEHPLPMERVRVGQVIVENSTLAETLPTLTMTLAQSRPDGEPVVTETVIRSENLLRLTQRSTVFETFVLDSNGVVLAHTDRRRVTSRATADWIPESVIAALPQPGQSDSSSLGMTREYVHRGVDMVGGFARVNVGRGLLSGVQVPKTAVYLTARGLLDSLVAVAFILLAAAALLGLFWSRLITGSIERLSKAAGVVAKGEFDVRVAQHSTDEIGMLARSFNQMTTELSLREGALKQAHAALIQSEKMAAFGQLGAGIAHEVKNPLAGILGYAQLAMRKVDKEAALYHHLEIIEKETRRCKTIIENLLRFARQERAEYVELNLSRVAEDAIAIVDHQLTINGVTIERRFADAPPVIGDANQLQQVIMNLLINAQQAMEPKGGAVVISTRTHGEGAELVISDNGPGIPLELRQKIFEPFFTTKPAGKGTGLGLSVTYGILRDHRADVRIEGEPGQGAVFVIAFPPPRSAALPGVPARAVNE